MHKVTIIFIKQMLLKYKYKKLDVYNINSKVTSKKIIK